MEVHNIHDSALFNEENAIAQSSTLDTSETDPKQMLSHSMTTDTLTGSVVYTSAIEIPCGFNTPMLIGKITVITLFFQTFHLDKSDRIDVLT
jgi:hypothetical protein